MCLDLTLIAGAKEYVEAQPSRTELFRSPLVSFLYERGWRQNFNLTGFLVPKRSSRWLKRTSSQQVEF
ncbi:hypothetical protein Hanom_Chr00s022212g01761471 [Helianthus anomalus]